MYQPRWADGKTIGTGQRDADNRAGVIVDYLDRHGYGKGARILDFGAYTGYFAHRLADQLGCSCVAVDNHTGLKSSPRVEVINEHLTPQQIRKLGKFDAVLCLSVLHHLPNWQAYLDAFRKSDVVFVETSEPAEHLPKAAAHSDAATIKETVKKLATGILTHTPGFDKKHDRPLWVIGTPAAADIIMLSRASTPDLHAMTQHAINTSIAGAAPLPVNVIVLEQVAGVKYVNAQTITHSEPFNYNRYMNRGARHGTAPWLIFANNDLTFRKGWLQHLIAANHPFVSPKEPRDTRQSHIHENTTGTTTGTHMSGWCYALTRDLWNRIGGLDECVNFWCSDDVVIEQCRTIGVDPMLVVNSVVEHKGSVTFNTEPHKRDERTWADLKRFNDKYGTHRLSTSRDYTAWLERQQR